MEFRFARLEDAAALAAMNRELIRDEGHRNPMTVEELAARIDGWLRGSYRAALFSRDGVNVGYALFRVEERGAWLRQLYVVPGFRRRGVGRAALAWLSARAWPKADRLRVEVPAGNATAREFWRAMGFKEYSVAMEASLAKLSVAPSRDAGQ